MRVFSCGILFVSLREEPRLRVQRNVRICTKGDEVRGGEEACVMSTL